LGAADVNGVCESPLTTDQYKVKLGSGNNLTLGYMNRRPEGC